MVVSGNSFEGESKKEYATMKLKAMVPERIIWNNVDTAFIHLP